MVEAFGADPFNSVFFLTDEFGKITRYNNVVLPKVRNLVADHINTLVPNLKAENLDDIGIRQTHIELNDEKLFGLYFVSNLYDGKDDNTSFTNHRGIIYCYGDTAYKYSSFIILEDVFNRVFGVPHSLYKPDLSMERKYYGQNNEDATKDIIEEDEILLYQHKIIESLMNFYYSIFSAMPVRYGIDMTENFEWIYSPSVVLWLESDFNPLYELIGLAAIRRYMKEVTFSGFNDDKGSFDNMIFLPFLAQHMFFKENGCLHQGEIQFKDNPKELTRILSLLITLESDEFHSLPLYKKYLTWHKLMTKED